MIDWPYLTIPLITWLVAQLIKFGLSAFHGTIDFRRLYQSGSMPSGHTALIVASATTIGVVEGGSSALFGFALVVSLIIIYDALGVRRTTGLQGQAIQELYDELQGDKPLEMGTARGHTPAEVLTGGALGFGLALLLTYEHSLSHLDIRFAWLILGLTGVALLGGLWWQRRTKRAAMPIKQSLRPKRRSTRRTKRRR